MDDSPKISVILPLFNNQLFIAECIESIRNQTFTDWEFIIVNDFGSDDGCSEIVQQYAKHDIRIRLIQCEERLGLSESLNLGISIAQGKYIARVDVDDPSYPDRFQRQYDYLEKHPNIFMCGTMQRSVLPDRSYVLEVPCDYEELKAGMLFGCEISHCSVMFRRDVWEQQGFRYNRDSLCEDYDLWTRIMFEVKIVNLPEVLVDHRWGFENISIQKGEKLYRVSRDISRRTLSFFDIHIDEEDDFLVAGWRNRPVKYAKINQSYFLRKTYWLLRKIEEKNHQKRLIDENALKKLLWKRWNWACECCSLFFHPYSYEQICHEWVIPKVSVIMPVFAAVTTIRETIDSIIAQTYTAWEYIIICDADNQDGSTEIAKYYANLDCRIKVICNTSRLGLAESLNVGMSMAQGDYIARIDADDLANARRLETQVAYMESHPNTGITQFYQHYFGQGANDFIHRPPITYEAMKAKLLFFCDACHSTVMIRKSIIEQYNLYYDSSHALEDFDLWNRAVAVTCFETIPEIYGEYRVGGMNISKEKTFEISEDMCSIISCQLKQHLGLEVTEEEYRLLNGWNNIFLEVNQIEKEGMLQTLQKLLLNIYRANKKYHYYKDRELLEAIAAKWQWSKYDTSWHNVCHVKTIASAIEWKDSDSLKSAFKKLIKKPLSAIQTVMLHFDAKDIEHLSNVTKDVTQTQTESLNNTVEWWTWERYLRVERKIEELENQNKLLQASLTDLNFKSNKVEYVESERIRIVFLYQIASFWPAWESLYEECLINDCVDVRLVFLDETRTEKTQMQGAEQFLVDHNLDYCRFEEFDLEKFRPHVVVIQTPYDEYHRQETHWSNQFKARGYRVVYIPYGIEISDTEDSHRMHFLTNTIQNCWRIYTFSDSMKKDYSKYSSNRRAIRAVGLPRFDYFYNHKGHAWSASVEKRRLGRKVVVWKVHFPKTIIEKGKEVFVTPDLQEYVKFARILRSYSNLFFVFIPHPKFFEEKNSEIIDKSVRDLLYYLSVAENVWIDTNEDYRNSLCCADYIIIDRSAVMVEAGALDVPVLYVFNEEYHEPMTTAIKPLIDSYYQGSSCQNMVNFLDRCIDGYDTNKIVRQKAFEQCIPYHDGRNGKRVLEDIIHGVTKDED